MSGSLPRPIEMFGIADDLIKHVEQSPLLVRYELGIADNVDEEHIGDLKLDLLLNLRRTLREIVAAMRARPLDHSLGARSGQLGLAVSTPKVFASRRHGTADSEESTILGQGN